MGRGTSARLRVVYLLAVACGVFLIKPLPLLGALFASQAAL